LTEEKIKSLQEQIEEFHQKEILLDGKYVINNGQCKAITLKGHQCNRNAQLNRQYCWQHPRI